MKQRKNVKIDAEIKRLKKNLALPKKAREKALYGDLKSLCDEKSLEEYYKLHKDEIHAMKKRVTAKKIIKLAALRRNPAK